MDRSYDTTPDRDAGWVASAIETWDSGLAANMPVAEFPGIRKNESALRDWLAGLNRYGFAKLTGGAVESGALLEVAALFGCVSDEVIFTSGGTESDNAAVVGVSEALAEQKSAMDLAPCTPMLLWERLSVARREKDGRALDVSKTSASPHPR